MYLTRLLKPFTNWRIRFSCNNLHTTKHIILFFVGCKISICLDPWLDNEILKRLGVTKGFQTILFQNHPFELSNMPIQHGCTLYLTRHLKTETAALRNFLSHSSDALSNLLKIAFYLLEVYFWKCTYIIKTSIYVLLKYVWFNKGFILYLTRHLKTEKAALLNFLSHSSSALGYLLKTPLYLLDWKMY